MNDFARDNELKTRGNRVGLWSLVKTSVLDQKRMCVCAVHSLMSALGQKQTYTAHKLMSALPRIATAKADMCSAQPHVCFGPIADMPPSNILTFSVLRPNDLSASGQHVHRCSAPLRSAICHRSCAPRECRCRCALAHQCHHVCETA